MPPSKVLLVEGRDDREVIYQISNHAQIIRRSFDVEDKGGFSEVMDWLTEQLPIRIKASEMQFLGIMVDADSNADSRWQAIRARLSQTGYTNIPDQLDSNGTIIVQDGMPKIGLWIMPNNQSPGILENFISNIVPSEDGLWRKAQDCVDSIPVQERRFIPNDLAKAYIHTWLAWQKEPGTPLGQAITFRFLDVDSPRLKKLIEWLKELFEV